MHENPLMEVDGAIHGRGLFSQFEPCLTIIGAPHK